MDIWHRITFHKLEEMEGELNNLSVKYKKVPLFGDSYLISFDIAESDPSWPLVAKFVQQKNAPNIYDTIFTKQEILEAEWVRLKPIFEQGYPQPKDTFEWRDNTFSFVCHKCGIAHGQKAPFHLRKEPKMGKNDFLSLYWAYTLFCNAKVIAVFDANQFQGYEALEALIHRTNQSSKTVKQLFVPHIAKPGLADLDKEQPETCPSCGLTKYLSLIHI